MSSIVDRLEAYIMDEVHPDIFIGGEHSAQNPALLDQYQIGVVLSLQNNGGIDKEVLLMYQHLWIAYIHIPTPPDPKYAIDELVFPITNHLIQYFLSQKRKILVCCENGLVQAPTVVGAYLFHIGFLNTYCDIGNYIRKKHRCDLLESLRGYIEDSENLKVKNA